MQPHPAPFSKPILDRLADLLRSDQKALGKPLRILDPFAGTGRVFLAAPPYSKVTMIEIEKEFVEEGLAYLSSINGRLDQTVKWRYEAAESAGWLQKHRATYTHIVTSPTYGNRMRDPYRSKPGTQCRSYAQSKGGPLLPYNSGAYKLDSDQYWGINGDVMESAIARLVPGGRVYINVSDFYHTPKKGAPPERQPVGAEWVSLMTHCGVFLASVEQVVTRRFTRGENRHRVPYEYILTFEKE